MAWAMMTAAALSLFGAVLHGHIGGRMYMAAVNSSDLPPRARILSFVSWHMFTVFLAVSGLTLAYAAVQPAAAAMVWPLIAVHALGALLFAGLVSAGHADLARLPGGYLMAAVAFSAWLGLG